METIKHIVTLFPSGTFPLIAAAWGLSAFQEKLHAWLRVQSSKVKILLSGLLSLALVGLPVALGILQTNVELFGAYSTMVFTSMTYFYRFVIKEAPSVQKDLVVTASVPIVEPIVTPTPEKSQPETAENFVAKV